MLNQEFSWSSTKQLSGLKVLFAFFIPSAIAFTGFRVLLPKIVDGGTPSIIAWPAVASIMLFGFVLFAVFLLKKEARELQISFKQRACLQSLSLKQWAIYFGIILLGLLASFAFTPLSNFFMQIPGLSVPDYFPFFLNPAIDPMNTSASVLTPGFVLQGATWLIPLIALTLILNILTEELYFRAWLLPKFERFGKISWLINGTLFALYHTFQLWLLPQIIPISLATAYVVYKSKSIWPALVLHMIANTFTVIGMIMLINS